MSSNTIKTLSLSSAEAETEYITKQRQITRHLTANNIKEFKTQKGSKFKKTVTI